MTALPENEVWTPRDGLGDVAVKGSGIVDFGKGTFYIDLDLAFGGETKAFSGELDSDLLFSTFQLTNNLVALKEECGYSEEEAKEIKGAVDILCKYINRNITGYKQEYNRK